MNQRSEILFQADKAGYAIPAFNYSDIWELLAIVQVAREERAPVYVSSDMIVVEALGITMTGALGRQLDEDRHHAVVNHLDHSNSTSLCRLAIDNGYPSVMLDASLLTVEENIKKVKSVVDYAHPRNVIVEGEIGRIMGKNTEISYEGKEYLAKIEDVINMVEPRSTALRSAWGTPTAFMRKIRRSILNGWKKSTPLWTSRLFCTAERAFRLTTWPSASSLAYRRSMSARCCTALI